MAKVTAPSVVGDLRDFVWCQFCLRSLAKCLPGFPKNEMVDFKFTFDPAGANCELGVHEIRVPIHIQDGPVIIMRARAEVTMPNMTVSSEKVDFGLVECGRCKVATVQLCNPLDLGICNSTCY